MCLTISSGVNVDGGERVCLKNERKTHITGMKYVARFAKTGHVGT